MDFIEQYIDCEKKAVGASTFTERIAFTPYTHNLVNDPTRIEFVSELPFFVCTMHTDRAEDTINNLLNGLTEEEGELLQTIITKVFEVSSAWGNGTAPCSSLLRHLYQRRLIKHLLPEAKSFFEIGPGTGYLSLMLALDGKSVCNTDVTQAYYIYQHYLYESFECLSELTTHPDNLSKGTPPTGKVQHVPWWVYKDLPDNLLEVDVIIVNHAVCEMHILAVQHLLSTAEKLGYPTFFMESTGSDVASLTFDEVQDLFRSYGYSLSYSKHDVYTFKHQDTSLAKYSILQKRILYRLINLVPFIGALKKESQRYRSIVASLLRKLTGRHSRHRSIFPANNIRYENMLTLYKKILGKSHFKSLDEEFIDRIKPKS
jgi:hypothetical protein